MKINVVALGRFTTFLKGGGGEANGGGLGRYPTHTHTHTPLTTPLAEKSWLKQKDDPMTM